MHKQSQPILDLINEIAETLTPHFSPPQRACLVDYRGYNR